MLAIRDLRYVQGFRTESSNVGGFWDHIAQILCRDCLETGRLVSSTSCVFEQASEASKGHSNREAKH